MYGCIACMVRGSGRGKKESGPKQVADRQHGTNWRRNRWTVQLRVCDTAHYRRCHRHCSIGQSQHSLQHQVSVTFIGGPISESGWLDRRYGVISRISFYYLMRWCRHITQPVSPTVCVLSEHCHDTTISVHFPFLANKKEMSFSITKVARGTKAMT